MYAGNLTTTDVAGYVHTITIRLRDYGYVDSFPVRDRYDREEAERLHDFGRRAASLNIAGVPPVDLPLATRPLPRALAPATPLPLPGWTNRATSRERRPYRARHRTLIRRREAL